MLTLWAYGRYAEVQSLKSKVQSREAGGGSQESGVRSQNPESDGTPHATRIPRPSSILHPPSSIFYLLSLFFFALGLMSKPMLVTCPLCCCCWTTGLCGASNSQLSSLNLRPLGGW